MIEVRNRIIEQVVLHRAERDRAETFSFLEESLLQELVNQFALSLTELEVPEKFIFQFERTSCSIRLIMIVRKTASKFGQDQYIFCMLNREQEKENRIRQIGLDTLPLAIQLPIL